MLKVHPDVPNPESVLEEATRLGLTVLEEDKCYNLRKLGVKTESNRGYPNAYDVITGYTSIIGGKMEDGTPWSTLYFQGNRGFSWFRTSPILSIKKMGTKFEIETENSFYLLSEVSR